MDSFKERVDGAKEKKRAAFSSIIAAVFLTTLKLIVGIVTNSLGILSEAAHSGLDLMAAGTTYGAVTVSAKPPDEDHQYGHGKVESLAGLFEVALLIITCVWIVYEAWHRFIGGIHLAEANYVGFAVMGISIIVDFSRSRMLYRMARKHHSQALEADALHFSTDILSSSVVIVGLLFVRFGFLFADTVAALGVAVFTVITSLRLGVRTTEVLLDRAPEGMVRLIEKEAMEVDGVIDCHNIRTRRSGGYTFLDMHICVEENTPTNEAHEIASNVEKKVKDLVPRSDIVVHVEPSSEKAK